jgi:hypothetical protein
LNIFALHNDSPRSARFEMRPWPEGREAWERLATPTNGATLYHDQRWLSLLQRTYGFEMAVASITAGAQLDAGCLLARTRNPFSPRLIALPFSDSCPPLAADPSALAELACGLIRRPMLRGGCEIRGVALPPPWQVVNCFGEWSVDLRQTAAQLQRRHAAHFRRQVRGAADAGLSVRCGSSLEDLHGFYGLMLQTRSRQGVPVQSLRFFERVRELFSPGGDFEIWSVSQGGRLLASGIILRAFDCLHYKWSARRLDSNGGAAHLLLHSMIEQHAGAAVSLNLGRTDVRNSGLVRFKKDAGAEPAPLPYSFYPSAPKQVSAEVLSGTARLLSLAWRRLPLVATRVLGSALYRYMA